MEYNRSLDGVRALAIIWVMLFHFNYLFEAGWIGVQLFFVLSGYLITTILLKDRQKNFSFYIKRFYWRRSLRIFPLYYFYLLAVSLIFLNFSIPKNFLDFIPFLATYLYNYYPLFNNFEINPFFTHFWSLAVEEQFYLIWPFLIYYFRGKSLKIVIALFLIFPPLFRYLIALELFSSNVYEVGEVIYRLTPSQFDAFAFGAIIPIFFNNIKVASARKLFVIGNVIFWSTGLITMLSGLFDANPSSGWSSLGYPLGTTYLSGHIWSYSIINFYFFTLILWIISDSQNFFIKKFLNSALIVSIGKVSYGMYVYHWVILFGFRSLFSEYLGMGLVSFLIYFLITYITSLISFKLIEQYFIDLKNKKFQIKLSKKNA